MTARDSAEVASLQLSVFPSDWTCPSCGTRVSLPRSFFLTALPVSDSQLDQMARCACGCFVTDMEPYQMGLLMAALLNDAEEPVRWEPTASGWSAR